MFKLYSLKTIGFKRLEIPKKIVFPDDRVLIHGRNESGKSTLLESIHYALFGMGLRPSRRASNEDLINYNHSEALIELVFSIDEKKYHVRRTLKKTSGNEHQLNEVLPDGSLIEITSGANSVNDNIKKILHGIDSDALLNSCLVEQKELGKLEASSKQERIRAMSNLLNLEAFLTAKEDIKKDRNELERTNSDTRVRLHKAERATKEYKEAEKRREQAERRLHEIKEQQEKIKKETMRLVELLTTLEEMRKLKTEADEGKTRIEGLEEARKHIESQFEQVETSEATLKEIEKQLPEEQEKLEKTNKKLTALRDLQELEKKRAELRNQVEKTSLRLDEAARLFEESRKADLKVSELDGEINEYEPSKKAQSILPAIKNKVLEYNRSRETVERLLEEKNEIQDSLDALKDSEDRINNLEREGKRLENDLSSLQTRRNIGLIMAASGTATLLFTFIKSILILSALGVALLAGGLYLYVKGNAVKIEEQISTLRKDREFILGDLSRLKEYNTKLVENQRQMEEKKRTSMLLEEELVESFEDLPVKPRDYSSLISLDMIEETFNGFQEKLQNDLQTLTKLETERKTLKKTAESIEERKTNLEEQEKKLRQALELQSKLNQEISKKEDETGVTLNREKEIKEHHEVVQNKVTALLTRKDSASEIVKRKPVYQENLEKNIRLTKELEAYVSENQKKLEELKREKSVSLEDEQNIRKKHETALKAGSSLITEEKERKEDVREATDVMESTEELKKEFPRLQEENAREEFRLEAMRRAMVLLDTTRDSIMSGVKQNIEKNMIHFLPVLTEQRYNMARIDETDYRIEVYDREARQWRGKGVFSGATQDQFSLALRLAFAISTIPGSRGARPGFIFLDEPLSGFDAQRREGFMKLLRDELSQHFVQIIVISHLETLQEEFQHRIEMEAGKIIESAAAAPSLFTG